MGLEGCTCNWTSFQLGCLYSRATHLRNPTRPRFRTTRTRSQHRHTEVFLIPVHVYGRISYLSSNASRNRACSYYYSAPTGAGYATHALGHLLRYRHIRKHGMYTNSKLLFDCTS